MLDKKQTDVVLAIFYRCDEEGLFSIFLQRRNQYEWEFPGGKVEQGELLKDALFREVHEETKLDISHKRIENLGVFFHEYCDKIVCLNCFLIKSEDMDFNITDSKWFPLTLVADEKFPIIEGSKVIIQNLMRKFYA